MHRLRLFGGASIEAPGGPLSGAIAQRQRLAFLAVLSLAPTGLVSRDKLLALLWPELDPGKARRALSNALYVIKKDLGEESVAAVGDDLRLDRSLVAVDVLEFQEAVEAGELENAASLYTGPFLEGIHVREAPEFERWVDGERDRLAALYLGVLEGCAARATAEGRQKEAAEWWKRAAAQDPYNARIALGLMEAMAAAGDRAGALRHGQVHATLLEDEFGVEPDPAVRALEERLRTEAPVPARRPPVHAPAREAPPATVGTSIGKGEHPPAGPQEAAARPQDAQPRPEDSRPQPAFPPTRGPEALVQGLVGRLGKQRMVQWGLAYLAGAWFLLQALDVFSEAWAIPQGYQQAAFILLSLGFLLTLVLVWYHGEEGRQRVSGPELLIIAVLLVIAGGVLSLVRPSHEEGASEGRVLRGPGQDDRVTIAVLPFENFSPDPNDAYFAEGIHEEILSKLARISSLRVISRSSVMQFREVRPTVPEMAALLGTDYFLEGSARVAGGMVRLTAQLIHAGEDDHVWSAEYDQPLILDSLIAIQSRVADSVAARLQATLTPDERAQLASAPTDNLAAYELYLHGRFLWNQRTEPDLGRALELFRQAIALDSMYAYAYVGLADAYLIRYQHSFMEFEDAIPPAEEALRRALSIDPLLGEAHASLGSLQDFTLDLSGAVESFLRSLELAPNHATAHQWYALLMAQLGSFEEAVTHARLAAGLDPLARVIDLTVGWILHMSRDHAAAARHLETVTGRTPDFALAWMRLGEAYAALGRDEEALAAMGRGIELEPYPNFLLFLAWAHGKAGNHLEARAILDQVPVSDPLRRAQVHAVLGEADLALRYVEEGIQAHAPTVPYLGVDPVWDPLRSDPRFEAVLQRLGLSPPREGEP